MSEDAKQQLYHAFRQREGDLYVAFCPGIRTASQCATPEEPLANLREATELYLEDFPVSMNDGPIFLATFQIERPG